MATNSQQAISPLDSRYAHKIQSLSCIFTEAGLAEQRVFVEIEYLQALSQAKIIRKFTKKEQRILDDIKKFNPKDFQQIKTIEEKTHHDVKAVEYFIRQKIQDSSLKDISSFIHFGLTSEDINNLAYRLMVSRGVEQELLPQIKKLLLNLADLAVEHKDLPMLARTHGQAAIPTTLGKEIAVFASRSLPLFKQIKQFKPQGKLNGAVGGYQALQLAYPGTNWVKFSQKFITQLGFEPLLMTTQINPQDDLVSLFQTFKHLNSILIDLNQDIWRYISDGWLIQKGKEKHVGSSTMPQKINPIEFENSEGNLKMANGLLDIFIRELPISRLQRDLSDSTVRRNFGVGFGHCSLAYLSLNKGLKHISPNEDKIKQDLRANWNILSEAAQTLARKQGDEQAYEKLAAASKNEVINQKKWQKITAEIDPQLKELTPETYIGLSPQLAQQTAQQIYKLFKKGSS